MSETHDERTESIPTRSSPDGRTDSLPATEDPTPWIEPRRGLPPLQALEPLERSRRNARIAQVYARLADQRTLPRWGERFGLAAELEQRALEWIGAASGEGLLALLGDDPAFALQLVARGAAPRLLLPSSHAAATLQRLTDRALAEARARLANEVVEQERARRAAGWWAGSNRPKAKTQGEPLRVPEPPQPATVIGDADRLPIASDAVRVVVALDVLHVVSDWERVASEWARVLVPGGRLLLGTPSERDQDAAGFLSAAVRALWPQSASGLPRSQDLTWVLATQGLQVQSASVVRLRMRFEDLAALRGDLDAVRALCAKASESLRALYEIDEEGMTWRYQLVLALKRLKD